MPAAAPLFSSICVETVSSFGDDDVVECCCCLEPIGSGEPYERTQTCGCKRACMCAKCVESFVRLVVLPEAKRHYKKYRHDSRRLFETFENVNCPNCRGSLDAHFLKF